MERLNGGKFLRGKVMADDIRVAPSSEPSIPAQPTVAVNVPEDEVGECGMCGGSGEIRAIDHGDIPCPTCVSREKREQLGRAEDRIAELEGHLTDILNMAEATGWEKATTGRQILYREARAALAAPSGVTKCPDCGGNFELCRCHRT